MIHKLKLLTSRITSDPHKIIIKRHHQTAESHPRSAEVQRYITMNTFERHDLQGHYGVLHEHRSQPLYTKTYTPLRWKQEHNHCSKVQHVKHECELLTWVGSLLGSVNTEVDKLRVLREFSTAESTHRIKNSIVEAFLNGNLLKLSEIIKPGRRRSNEQFWSNQPSKLR